MHKNLFVQSPLPNRRSVLTDSTYIEEPKQKSWWKQLGENSREVIAVVESNEFSTETDNVEDLIEMELLSQEKKTYHLDLPESSGSESIHSIVMPQRKLFKQKENDPQKKFGELVCNRETLPKLHKTSDGHDKSIKMATRELFQSNKQRSKPIFPAALLDISFNKTASDKTKENINEPPKNQVRNIFGYRAPAKRRNMFAEFVVSESEEEIPEIQPKVFGFAKKSDPKRRGSNTSRGMREPSPASSITTDMEMDDWKQLPSSTMVAEQLEEAVSGTPVKRPRLSKLSEAKESEAGTNSNTNDKSKHSNKSVSKNKSKNSSVIKDKSLEMSMLTRSAVKNIQSNIVSDNPPCETSISSKNTSNKSKNSNSSLNRRNSKKTDKDSPTYINEIGENVNQNVSKSKTFNIEGNRYINLPNLIEHDECNEEINDNNDIDDINFTLEYENDDEQVNVVQNVDNKSIKNKTVTLRKDSSKTLHDVVSPKKLDKDTIVVKVLQSSRKTVETEESEILKEKKIISAHMKTNVANSISAHDGLSKEISDQTHGNVSSMHTVIDKHMEEDKRELNVQVESRAEQMEVDEIDEGFTRKVISNTSMEVNNHMGNYCETNQEKDQDKSQNKELDIVGENLGELVNKSVEKVHKIYHQNNENRNQSQNEVDMDSSTAKLNETKHSNAEFQMQEVNELISKQDMQNGSNTKVHHETETVVQSEAIEKHRVVIEAEEQDENMAMEQDASIAKNRNESEIMEQNENIAGKQIQNEIIEYKADERIVIKLGEQDDKANQQNESKIEKGEDETDDQNKSEIKLDEDAADVQNKSVIEQDEDEADEQNQIEIEQDEDEADEQNQIEIEQDEDEADEQNESEIEHDKDESDDQNESEIEHDKDESDDQNESEIEHDEDEANQHNESDAEDHGESSIKQHDVIVENNDSDVEEHNQSDVKDHNESEPEHDESAVEQQDETEGNNEFDVEEQNESMEQNESEPDEYHESDEDINNVSEEAVHNESREESEDVIERTATPNFSEVKFPEAVLHDKTNRGDSFTAQGRNTSVRKSQSLISPLDIIPIIAPHRNSTGFSDGTRNSTAEGSGWDSHRTTRKTLRQTFGRDFSPRKSLRALVMEKSAKRHTAYMEGRAEITSLPQANSTEFPEMSNRFEDEETLESDHERTKRSRQATLEIWKQIKKKNMEQWEKEGEKVRNMFMTSNKENTRFKVPRPIFETTRAKKQVKSKKEKQLSSLMPLDYLPPEILEDMKYKPPKRFQPRNVSWITKHLYKFLETKLEPKYDYKARVRAEKLVETIYNFTKSLKRHRVAPTDAVDVLKHEMARLDIVKTHFDFDQFFRDYMPREIRIKVIPDIVNKIPLPKHGIFADILPL